MLRAFTGHFISEKLCAPFVGAALAALFFMAFFPSPSQAQLLTGYEAQENQESYTLTSERLLGIEEPEVSVEPSINKAPVKTFSPIASDRSVSSDASKEPVDLQADKLVHNEEKQIITASGNVMMQQAGRILRADKISYNLKTDTVTARGNVVLNEPNGDIHYSKEVRLNDKFKNGFVRGLQSFLIDGARFTARKGKREGGTKTTMYGASYTPCEVCEENPDRPPVWQIRASQVTHDEEDRRISYENARFEILGVPVAYTPYFSHPDGTIKRKSGFLLPYGGYKSELGIFVENSYYWDIAPNKDATVGIIAMTEEAPLAFGQWRQRWPSASLEVEGGITYSERTAKKAGVDQRQEEEVRGHVLAEGLWDINQKWRSGVNVEWASDDQYMRQYDFASHKILESEVYAERFSGRDYAVGRLLAFQDTRVGQQQGDQPEILPEIIASFKGEPNSVPVLKGRWSLDASLLGLRRNGDDQDMNRVSVDGGWYRHMVSNYGLLTNVQASARADFYNTRDRDVATPGSGQESSNSETRFYPNLHVQSSYPLVKGMKKAQATIEPIVSLTLSPNVDVNNDIPNEDSQDVQIDASNIFEPNRFPGLDRIEDKSRVTYGVRTGLYGYGGSHGDIFLGQSHRLDDDDNPFPVGSGLDNQDSDVVGQISGLYNKDYSLNYRFQLSSENLSPQRHEVYSYMNLDKLRLNGRYLFAKELGGTDINESREQLQGEAAYYVTEDWRARIGGTKDLGDDPGLRKASLGVDYFGQCLSWSLTGRRNLTEDSSGESNTEILFRIGLKNLGEFTASGLRAPGAKE